MRIAALYDIHGNLPALNAVLADVRRAGVDQIVVGGDVLPGPMPLETLQRLLALDVPVRFIHGNGDLAVLAQMTAAGPDVPTYWGSVSGAPLPAPVQDVLRWNARQLRPEHEHVLAAWPKIVRVDIDSIGPTLFCHSTPRSETEVFTRLTAEDRLIPLFDGHGARLAVCGHTHMQFDRMIGRTRVVNAGSVGMPFGSPGAYWALLGPDVQLKCTQYDLDSAAETIGRTSCPQVLQLVDGLVKPASESVMLDAYGKIELR